MRIADLMRLVWKRRTLFLIVVAASVALAIASTFIGKPKYVATAEMFFSVSGGDSAGDLNQASTYLDREMTSYAALVQTPLVLDPAIKALGLPVDASSLASQLTVQVPTSTTLLDITVADVDAAQSAKIANAIAESTTAQVARVAPTPKGSTPSVTATLITRATAPSVPTGLGLPVRAALGLLAGLVLGLAAVLLANSYSRRVRDVSHLEQITQRLPLVGVLSAPAGSDQPNGASPTSRDEEFRRLRATLGNRWPELLRPGNQPRTVLFTSPRGDADRSAVALGLARTLSEAGQRVVLVDADLRNQSLTKQLGSPQAPGLADVLTGQSTLADATRATAIEGVSVVGAGSPGTDAGRLLSSTRMGDVLSAAASGGEVVIIDATGTLDTADAATLAALTQHVALVVDMPTSTVRDVTRATASPLNATNLVVIANRAAETNG